MYQNAMLVNEFLEHSAQRFPGKVALVCHGRRWTYRDLDAASNSIANGLIARGVEPGDRVAIYVENSVEAVVSIFGALKAAGVFVVVNPQVKPGKLEYILKDCGARLLVTSSGALVNIEGVIDNCDELGAVIVTGPGQATKSAGRYENRAIESYQSILESYPASRPDTNRVETDLASLIYTSGSTGFPKGVMLTHLSMVTAASSIIEYLENSQDDIIIDCLPLSFDYGLYQVLMAFKFGGTVVLERTFTYPFQIVDLMIKEKVTGFPLVPGMAAILLQFKQLGDFDFSHLRYITNTGQAFPRKHIVKLRELLPHVRIYSMYGLTECKRVSYLHPSQIDVRPTSVGKAMPNTEAYIVDQNGSEITEPGVIGELVVKGDNVMEGYWNLPEETAKRLKRDSASNQTVLYTGDLFKRDEEGYLYFVSRRDDMIKTAGQLVSPKEVENAIYEMKDVAEVAVIGVDDEILGKSVKAVVALNNNSNVIEDDVISHCSKHLERHMVPKHVEFRRELPKSPSGKIRKTRLAE